MNLRKLVVVAALGAACSGAFANVSVSTVGSTTTYSENFNGGTSFDHAWFDAPFTSDDHLFLSALSPSSTYTFSSAVALATLDLSFWYSVPGDGNGIVGIAGSAPNLLGDTPGNVLKYLLNNPGPGSSGAGAFDAYFSTRLTDVGPGSYSVTFATAGGLFDSLKVDDVTITAIAAVPEPQTYALMMLGLGVLGAVSRRSKRRQAELLFRAAV
jgi:hypothetical protein